MAKDIYQKLDSTEFFPTPKEIRDDLYAMLPENVHYILDPWKPLNEWTDLELVKRNEELSSMSGWQFTKSEESELWNVQDEMSRRHLYL